MGKFLDLNGLAKYDAKIKKHIEDNSGIVYLGEFANVEELIAHAITNQLPTGTYMALVILTLFSPSPILLQLTETRFDQCVGVVYGRDFSNIPLHFFEFNKDGTDLHISKPSYLEYDRGLTDHSIDNILYVSKFDYDTGPVISDSGIKKDDIATKTHVDSAIQAAIQNTWNGEY